MKILNLYLRHLLAWLCESPSKTDVMNQCLARRKSQLILNKLINDLYLNERYMNHMKLHTYEVVMLVDRGQYLSHAAQNQIRCTPRGCYSVLICILAIVSLMYKVFYLLISWLTIYYKYFSTWLQSPHIVFLIDGHCSIELLQDAFLKFYVLLNYRCEIVD